MADRLLIYVAMGDEAAVAAFTDGDLSMGALDFTGMARDVAVDDLDALGTVATSYWRRRSTGSGPPFRFARRRSTGSGPCVACWRPSRLVKLLQAGPPNRARLSYNGGSDAREAREAQGPTPPGLGGAPPAIPLRSLADPAQRPPPAGA